MTNISTLRFFDEESYPHDRNDKSYCGGMNACLDIKVCEVRDSDFSLFLWPGGIVLGWFLWKFPHLIINKRVLEIGAGVSVPSLVALKVKC